MGRTGVFITLSIVLERMQYEGVVDVFQTARILRTQRPAMVQTEVNDTEGSITYLYIYIIYNYFVVKCIWKLSLQITEQAKLYFM